MKIYPGNHIITGDNEQVTQSEMQLGYYKEADKNAVLHVTLDESLVKLRQQNNRAVYPFQRFGTDKILFFKRAEEGYEAVEGADCIKRGNDYYYFEPKNTLEYVPPEFTYSVRIKKEAGFRHDIDYNISFKCYNDFENGYAENLVSVLGSACTGKPDNVIFNSNQDTYYSLVAEDNDNSNSRLDFLVLSYDDFKKNKEDILGRLDKHTNLWVVDESFDGALKHIYTNTLYPDDINIDTSKEFSVIVENYIANDNDIRVWVNDIELVKGTEFYEARFDDKGNLVKIEEKDGAVMTNVIIFPPLSGSLQDRNISYYIESADEVEFVLQNPVINPEAELVWPKAGAKKCFDVGRFKTLIDELLSDGNFEITELFKGYYAPMLMVHRLGAGYIIFSSETEIRQADSFKDIIFDLVMRAYLNGYFETDIRTEYIADEKIDYIYNLKNRLNLSHRRIDLERLLYEDGYNMKIEFDPLFEVICEPDKDDSEKTVVNITSPYSNELRFRRKARSYVEKKPGEVSLFTVNNTVMNLDMDSCVMYILEDLPVISDISNENRLGLRINTMRSSHKGINSLGDTNLFSDAGGDDFLLNTSYTLYHDNTLKKILAARTDRYNTDDKIRLAELTFKSATRIEIGDIRQYGGGEISANKNYEMIDSSSLKGRPLRIGSAFIIKLPMRFSKYRDILEAEIKKHIASGDYPMLVFTNEL